MRLWLLSIVMVTGTGCATLQSFLDNTNGQSRGGTPIHQGILRAAEGSSFGIEQDVMSELEGRYRTALDAIDPTQYPNPDRAREERERLSTADGVSSVMSDWLGAIQRGASPILESIVEDQIRAAGGQPPPVILPGVDRKYGVIQAVPPPALTGGTLSIDGINLGPLSRLSKGVVVRRERHHEMAVIGQVGETCKVEFAITVDERSPKVIGCP